MIILRYDKGSLLIKGETGTPYAKWDPRIDAFRAMGIFYPQILEYLQRSNIDYRDEASHALPIESLSCGVSLRPYQDAALKAWMDAKRRGVIVLPTGAGKTFIALKAIDILNVSTLIVVPTLDLLNQWTQNIATQFGVESGAYGGGEKNLKPLTIATYDSTYYRAEQLGNKFMFIIFDEVHHLPAPSFRQIAEMYIAPYRMGLTATYEREDNLHTVLPELVGGCVFRLKVEDLAGKHLSPYKCRKIHVNLTDEEQKNYHNEYNVFLRYLSKGRIKLRNPRDFKQLIMRSGRDPEARRALLARNNALKIALNSENKIKALANLLLEYANNKILIFTRFNSLVYEISRIFLIPSITYRTSKDERKEIIQGFRSREYKAIVTSQVLDEGIDVPDASIGIILGGTGSSREYIQRLGRILRKRPGKEANLIEIVSRETLETGISRRRHRKVKNIAAK